MRFGVFLLSGRFPGQDDGAALRRSLDAVVMAEEVGFDDAWFSEHHFMPYGVCPSAVTFAALALGRTRRIGVGTAVSVLSNTHPVALAEQTAMLDQLSGGRFRLGVGRGGPWIDLEVFGTGLDRYERGFPDSVDLLLDCLARDRVGADGEHFRFREVPMVPAPVTRPHPPVVIGATSRPTVELAARRGLPLLLGMDTSDDEKADLVTHYATIAAAAGHDPDAVPHLAAALTLVADSSQQARQELFDALPGWIGPGLAAHRPVDDRPGPNRDPIAYTEQLCSINPIGSGAECADRLRTTAERTGIRHFILSIEGAGSHARALDNIARISAEVLPALRD